MAEQYKALVVLLVLMAAAWKISRELFFRAVDPKYVDQLHLASLLSTVALFLLQNMWLYFAAIAIFSIIFVRGNGRPLGLFVFMLLVMPGFSENVPGFGLVNYFIELNPARLLALTVLLPAAIKILRNKVNVRQGKNFTFTDKLVILYAMYTSYLVYLFVNTFTGFMRGAFESLLDFVLIYFVASRCMNFKNEIRHVIVAFISACVFLAMVSGFEFLRHWLLYSHLQQILGVSTEKIGYLSRGTVLRSVATTGQPIALGYVMMVAFLFMLYARNFVLPGLMRWILYVILLVGLIASMSRGPWVGCILGLLVYILCSSNALINIIKLAGVSYISFSVMLMIPGGRQILDYLPWIGSIDSANITYREMLWNQSMQAYKKNFWLGSFDFASAPEFDSVRQGGGFIDIVNTYLVILIKSGFLGLVIYLSVLITCLIPVVKINIDGKFTDGEIRVYAAALLAAFVASIITLATVSSIYQIAPVAVLLLGATAATSEIMKQSRR